METVLTITLISARAKNGVIGKDNKIPWYLPEDLQHFRSTTLGAPVIVGRKTFDSIGKPLPGRTMIVLTRDTQRVSHGCLMASSMEESVAQASNALLSLRCNKSHDSEISSGLGVSLPNEIFIAGGSQIYEMFYSVAQRALITEVHLEPEGDTYFPNLSDKEWCIFSEKKCKSGNHVEYTITDYRRS